MKDADAVRNLADIVSQHKDEDILLVVSAMGKTTNALEKALANFREHDGQLGMEALHEVITYHDGIIQGLFDGNTDPRFDENIAGLFIELPASSTNTSASVTSPPVGLMRANMSLPKMRPTTAPPILIGTKRD